MPGSVWGRDVQAVIDRAARPTQIQVPVGADRVTISTPFPSPADWRDHWIYFLLVDRFNNPSAPPGHLPFDGEHGVFQGGTFNGVRAHLAYLQALGVGAIWLSPVVKNCQFEDTTYHGYGFQDFLAVEPRFASDPAAARANPALAERELRDLVDAAHARGMYVIFDVVLNHAGNVFEYPEFGATAPFRDEPYPIRWRDERGAAAFEDFAAAPPVVPADAAVWPIELQQNTLFRRQGKGGEAGGDFESLKELDTGFAAARPFGRGFPVRETLIRAYQYLIARFDVDGFRIDTLKFIEPEFARLFGNAAREFALSIGKRNFLTFGEVFDEEEKIARFIGRQASDPDEMVGVDAALDFPLFFRLPGVAKGFAAPDGLAQMYRRRKEVQRTILTSHGEASGHFITFLDNHDMRERFHFREAGDPHRLDDQVTLALGCLFALLGVPCVYYGTEQGLAGRGASDQAVREALWGQANAFDRAHPFYRAIQRLAAARGAEPALRYGRQYFRPLSGNGVEFGLSPFPAGVLAFARILNDREVLVVANTHTTEPFSGEIIVDASLNPEGTPYGVLFSNKDLPQSPGSVATKPGGSVTIREPDGGITPGPARVVRVTVGPMEVQWLTRTRL